MPNEKLNIPRDWLLNDTEARLARVFAVEYRPSGGVSEDYLSDSAQAVLTEQARKAIRKAEPSILAGERRRLKDAARGLLLHNGEWCLLIPRDMLGSEPVPKK